MKDCPKTDCEAIVHQNHSRWIEAQKACSEAGVDFCAHANYIRAFVVDMCARKDEALIFINRAIELSPNWAKAYYFKANILFGIYTQSFADESLIEEIVENYLRSIVYADDELADMARYSIVDLYRITKEYKKAIETLKQIKSSQLQKIAKIDMENLEEQLRSNLTLSKE